MIKIQNIHQTLFLVYLQGVTIININLQGHESFAPEKLCSVLFSTSRLKITMQRHVTSCMCQDNTSNSYSCAVDYTRLQSGLKNKSL